MPAARAFLTAEWHDVLGLTYAADEALLGPYLPRGAQIDALDGSPRVSLVAFGFRHTRVRGIAIPGHITFPEINLRFYVRMNGERAVVFIREFVPRQAISIVARLAYNEPYRTIPMEQRVTLTPDELRVRHRFGKRKRNVLEAVGDPTGVLPAPDSPEHWLTHHDVGVGRTRRRRRAQLPRRARAVGAARGPLAARRRRLRRALWRALGAPRPNRTLTCDACDGLRGARAHARQAVISAQRRRRDGTKRG